jgi:hypothetical protein
MKNFLSSENFKKILWGFGIVAFIFFVFGLGVAVGYKEAIFSSSWGRNYYKNFYGGLPNILNGPNDVHGNWNSHGVAGVVINMSTSTILIRNTQNDERFIYVSPQTVIKKANDTISIDKIMSGDNIIVIGEASNSGQILSQFIRVFDGSSSIPLPPPDKM